MGPATRRCFPLPLQPLPLRGFVRYLCLEGSRQARTEMADDDRVSGPLTYPGNVHISGRTQ